MVRKPHLSKETLGTQVSSGSCRYCVRYCSISMKNKKIHYNISVSHKSEGHESQGQKPPGEQEERGGEKRGISPEQRENVRLDLNNIVYLRRLKSSEDKLRNVIRGNTKKQKGRRASEYLLMLINMTAFQFPTLPRDTSVRLTVVERRPHLSSGGRSLEVRPAVDCGCSR